jgi:hypothetical protein
MALRFTDSFDHYATALRLTKWTSSVNSPAITASGRFGSGMTNAADGNSRILRTLDAQPTWIIGAAVSFSGGFGVPFQHLTLNDAGTEQVSVRVNASGQLIISRAGTTLATGTTVLSVDVFNYIELKATINNSGTAVVHLNGVLEISFSGDTQNTANATANGIQLFGNGAGSTITIDDLYVCDGTGSAPTNDFLGDVRIEALFPSGNGNSSQFDGSDGNSTDNYLLVDEATPDDDTTYVQSADVGDKDTYAYTNLVTSSGSVYGIQMLPYARKTDAGSRQIVSTARLSAVETDSLAKALPDGYTYLPDIRETKPGGGAWTITDVNNSEFGQKVSG